MHCIVYYFIFFKCSPGDTLHKGYSDAVKPSSFYLVLFITLHFGVVFLIKYLSCKDEKSSKCRKYIYIYINII